MPSAIVGEVCDSRDQPAAADPDQDGVDVGHVVVDLQTQRPLADDDVGVVEGMDQDGAGALGELGGQPQRRLDRLAFEDHIRSVAARREELRHRNAQRHEDGRRDAELLGRAGDALRVVSR
jgi:hypothetical protein